MFLHHHADFTNVATTQSGLHHNTITISQTKHSSHAVLILTGGVSPPSGACPFLGHLWRKLRSYMRLLTVTRQEPRGVTVGVQIAPLMNHRRLLKFSKHLLLLLPPHRGHSTASTYLSINDRIRSPVNISLNRDPGGRVPRTNRFAIIF